jgi:hypothetical protein
VNNPRAVALHEAGHSYAAWYLHRPLGPVTIKPGQKWAGTSHYTPPALSPTDWDRVDFTQPYPLWPARVRRTIDTRALIAAAGDAAETAIQLADAPPARRIGEGLTERVATMATTRAEQAQLAVAATDTAGLDDAETLWSLMRASHRDNTATGTAWLAYITVQARAIVTAGAPRILALADTLTTHGTLSGRAARAILEGACSSST